MKNRRNEFGRDRVRLASMKAAADANVAARTPQDAQQLAYPVLKCSSRTV